MANEDAEEVTDADIWIEFSEYANRSNYVCVLDALEIMVLLPLSEKPLQFSYSALEHLFDLLDQLEQGESGRVLSGTGLLDVTITDKTVTLHGQPLLDGGTTDMFDLVTSLIEPVFVQLEREGFASVTIAEETAEHQNLQVVDPVADHNDAMD